ncbi:type II secretion system protein GspD, partial [Thermodesulfobacteriota bacterium]
NVLLMRAVQSDTETNILSTPHLIAMDNEESEIVIGKNVPFITGSSQTQVSTITSVSREDVGIKLKFTPQISEGDYIKLTLYQEISALSASPLGLDVNTVGPTTTERAATTTVMVKDGQTIVIGGLMQDTMNNTENKVPFLGDIPVLGWLFRYNSNNLDKTNLMIFIRPKIIKEDRDVDELAKEYKEKYEAYKSRAINVQNESDWTKFFDSEKDGSDEEAPPEDGDTSGEDGDTSGNDAVVEEPEQWEFTTD